MTNYATETMTCGLDLGDKLSYVCLLDGSGEVVEETRLRTTQESMGTFFARHAPMRVVLEVSSHSRWVQKLVTKAGHEAIVANARRVQLISQNERKTDRVDAELLARLGRADPTLLKPIQHRTDDAQKDIVLLRARAALMRARTLLINCVRGVVKTVGARIKSCASDAFGKRTEEIPESLRPALAPMMDQIRKLTAEIRSYDKQIKGLAEGAADIAPLLTTTGVGALTAVAFVRTLEDPTRFRNGRAAAAYIGLVPRRSQSGGLESAAAHHKVRRLVFATAAGQLCAVHPRPVRKRQRAQTLGPEVGRARRQKRQEARGHCGRAQARRDPLPLVDDGPGLLALPEGTPDGLTQRDSSTQTQPSDELTISGTLSPRPGDCELVLGARRRGSDCSTRRVGPPHAPRPSGLIKSANGSIGVKAIGLARARQDQRQREGDQGKKRPKKRKRELDMIKPSHGSTTGGGG